MAAARAGDWCDLERHRGAGLCREGGRDRRQQPNGRPDRPWLAVAGVLWAVPFGLGWLAGRISRRRRGRPVTVVLKSGATIAGTLHHATATEFVLADATVEARRYALVTINRCDAELLLSGSHVAVAHPSDDRQLAIPLVVAPRPRDDRRAEIATTGAEAVAPIPANVPPS